MHKLLITLALLTSSLAMADATSLQENCNKQRYFTNWVLRSEALGATETEVLLKANEFFKYSMFSEEYGILKRVIHSLYTQNINNIDKYVSHLYINCLGV